MRWVMKGCRLSGWVLGVWLVGAALGWTQEARHIAQIQFQGLRRVPESTARYYVQSREGDLYDPDMVRQDFRRLWEAGFFEDLRVEAEEGPEGVRLVFRVQEKPIIEQVVWPEKVKGLRIEDIRSKMNEKGLTLYDGDPYDAYRVHQVEQLIRQMLAEKGYRFPEVRPVLTPLSETSVRLTWQIDPGESLRIGQVIFDGNQAFSDDRLRRVVPIKPSSLWSRITGKDKYDPQKLEKSQEALQHFYYDHGYLDFRVGEPRVEVYTGRSWWSGAPVRRLRVVFPVHEGPPYRIGEVRLKGLQAFSEADLKKLLRFRSGHWFRQSVFRKSLQDIQAAYGEKGYLFVGIYPDLQPRVADGTHFVDVNLQIQEGKPQVVRRIEFQGNTYTHDLVVRREMDTQEARVINTKIFRRDLQKIYRIGYFDKVEPDVRPVPGRDDQVDVVIRVNENKRNQISAGGGYSQLDGLFGQLGFSTQNLFGTGKSFSFSLQYGKRIKTYYLSVLDPYFLNSDWQVGFSVYNTWNNYFIYERRDRGGSLVVGWPLTKDLDFRVGYSYSQIRLENVDPQLLASGLLGIRPEDLTRRRDDSRVTPQLIYNSLGDPLDPTEGIYATASVAYAGGPLGGNVSIVAPSFRWRQYFKVNRWGHRFAYNVELGWVRGYGGRAVPFYERFFLGGDFTVRGYDFRTVGPIDPKVSTRYTVGGTKYALFNLEYIVPVGESPLRLVAFWDGGNAYAPGEALDPRHFRFSTGLELRIVIPMLMQPIRFIFARNWNRGPVQAPAWNFRFGFGLNF